MGCSVVWSMGPNISKETVMSINKYVDTTIFFVYFLGIMVFYILHMLILLNCCILSYTHFWQHIYYITNIINCSDVLTKSTSCCLLWCILDLWIVHEWITKWMRREGGKKPGTPLPPPSTTVLISTLCNYSQQLYGIKWLNGKELTRKDVEASVQGLI